MPHDRRPGEGRCLVRTGEGRSRDVWMENFRHRRRSHESPNLGILGVIAESVPNRTLRAQA